MRLLASIDRRTLIVGGGVGVGLIVAFTLWPRRLHSDLAPGTGEQAFGNYIKVARDGRVTVAVPQVETGQGIWTSLPQIVADELGSAWESVAVEPAPLTGAYANPLAEQEGWPDGTRITAASTSVRGFEQPLREAAAIARTMLVGAAADRWNVDPRECESADGFILHSGRTFTFGELAEEAAHRSPPNSPLPRQTQRSPLMGQPLPRLDGRAKCTGGLRFAADVRLPGMLFASARLAPTGGRLTAFSREAIGRMTGVRHVTVRDAWIAVVADTWWAAEQAVTAAGPRFTGLRSPADLRTQFEAELNSGGVDEWFTSGDYDLVTRGSRALAATYYAAPSQHLGLETLTATARASGGRVDVWAPTQAPEAARKRAEKASGGARVDFYPMPVGEPGGRALEADAIPIVVELARAIGRPVQLSFSQSASQNHDHLSGGMLARMTALPGADGITAAWKMRVAAADGFGAAIAALVGREPPANLGRTGLDGAVPPYGIPNIAIEAVPVSVPFDTGYMRGSPQRELTFFTESFTDELARAVGQEPLAFRMSMLGGNGRLARCLQAAARLAQWDGGRPGSTMGIAGCSAFGSHIGLVAVASIDSGQRIRAHKLVAAVDCGRIVNSGLVRQQIEGGLIWAVAQAVVPQPEWLAGMPRAGPMGGLGLPRIGDAPEIMVEIIPSGEASGGLSGLGTTVVAPAVANAIFAGTGRRLRDLPFDVTAAA